jgi:hypothetical protein
MRALFVLTVAYALTGGAAAQTADPNGDGKMTPAELALAFKARLMSADKNRDGKLDLAEMKGEFKEGGGILYAYDKNNDDALSGAEIDTAAALEADLGVGLCDKDGDEAVSGAEIACYVKSK